MPRAVLVMLLVALGCSRGDDSSFLHATSRLRFDAAAWATGNERWAMCDDLRGKHLELGMTREDVIKLLGPPTNADAGGLQYDVGGYWLDILLNPQGRVRDTRLCSY